MLSAGIDFAIDSLDMTTSLKNRIEFFERREIERALVECGWIMAQAARKLGITERMIGYKIKKYGIRKEAMRQGSGNTTEI